MASKLAFHLPTQGPSRISSLPYSTPCRSSKCRFPPMHLSNQSNSDSPPSPSGPFTDLEHKNWQRGVDAYERGFGPLTAQAVPTLLDRAAFPPPSDGSSGGACSLLDVACGPGQVVSAAITSASAATASSRSTFSYTALDFSANFLRLAETNLGNAHPGVDVVFIEGDAQSMPFDDDTFTSVACNFGVLHLSDPDAFLSESYRVLKPGGCISFSAWAPPPATEAFDLILGAVNKAGNPDVVLPEGPPFFRFSDPAEITRSLNGSGFEEVGITTVDGMVWDNVKNAEQLFDVFLEGTARTRELLRGQTAEETVAVKVELQEQWKTKTNDGQRSLCMPAVVSSGRKPL